MLEKMIFYALIITISNCFYLSVGYNSRCFYTSLFQKEQLIIEVQTPIMQQGQYIQLKVNVANTSLYDEEIKNVKVKQVVKKIQNLTDLEHQVCMELRNRGQKKQNSKKDYLVSLKLMKNFEHKLEKKIISRSEQNINYEEIKQIAEKLNSLNEEQINLHIINEEKQKKTEDHLQHLKQKVIYVSLGEIIMAALFFGLQINLLKEYIKKISIV